MNEPTKMPEWLERQFSNAEKTVASWPISKQIAAGIKNVKPIPISSSTPNPHMSCIWCNRGEVVRWYEDVLYGSWICDKCICNYTTNDLK